MVDNVRLGDLSLRFSDIHIDDSYRYQLEAFVDKVRGRTPHAWVSEEDSVNQMKAVEMVYEKVSMTFS